MFNQAFGIISIVLLSVEPAPAYFKSCHFVSGGDTVIGKVARVAVSETSFRILFAPRYQAAQTSYPLVGVKGNVLVYAGHDADATGDGYVIRVGRSLLSVNGSGVIGVRLDNGVEGYVDTIYHCQ